MYSTAFCKVYNQFGWNYFPEAFGEQLLTWLKEHQVTVRKSLDLACGTGVLCEILAGSWDRGQRNGFFRRNDQGREGAEPEASV